MTKMLAARAHAGEDRLRIEDVDKPEAGEGDVIVRVRSSGLGRGLLTLWRHRRDMMRNLPTVLGFEIAGEIDGIGPGVPSGWKAGDAVFVHSALSCGRCDFCLSGEQPDCAGAANIGHVVYTDEGAALYDRYHNGGLAEFVKVPWTSLERVPEGISFEVAARIPSLGVSYRNLERCALRPGDALVVTGATGAYGAAAVAMARLFGVSRIIAVGRSAESFERIAKLAPGMKTVALDSLPEDWRQSGALTRRLREMTSGRGADALSDFMPGDAAVTAQCVMALRKNASAVLTGGNFEPLAIPYGVVMQSGYVIRGSRGLTRKMTPRLTRLVSSGQIPLGDLISHRFRLGEANDAVELIDMRLGKPLFIAVNP